VTVYLCLALWLIVAAVLIAALLRAAARGEE
jgi:hypothetical protein